MIGYDYVNLIARAALIHRKIEWHFDRQWKYYRRMDWWWTGEVIAFVFVWLGLLIR